MPLESGGEIFVYLVNSSVLIDGGFCSAEQAEQISKFTEKFGKVDKVLITHHHIDHVGLIFFKPVQAYIHQNEVKLLEVYTHPDNFLKFYLKYCKEYGVPEKYTAFTKILSSMKLAVKARIETLSDGNEIYGFKVIHTPGHTPGHLCFYREGILFSGDTVLSDTTPHISPYPYFPGRNPVEDYLKSLQKLMKLDLEIIYPAHGEIIRNPRKRIEELVEHYLTRIDEIFNLLNKNWRKLEDIAKEVNWSTGDYSQLDSLNRFLAIGETAACLEYLKRAGKITEGIVDGIVQFRKC
jgi:glyoxylase-like metal-dependent hydrolase (beta-lactamase superfamily II)